jgi:alpha-D-ribose 1-methylphosphonate 5-triphosphate diphosphatase PhnM
MRGELIDGQACPRCQGTLRYKARPDLCVMCQRERLNKRQSAKAHKNYQREYQKTEKYRVYKRQKRAADRFAKYQLTHEQATTMLTEQHGRCAICETTLVKYAIDHDHTTGVVRGLLCNSCNLGIGLLRDNTTILKKAIEYLTK